MNTNEIAFLEVPLGFEAHRFARQFAAEQDTPQKRKQVYLNTLAVYAVHRYLQWLQVDTDLSRSDSWHPVLRNRWDVADLFIPGIGKLECRPVLPGETAFTLPSEVTEDRIGYIGVQFSEQLDYVQLLGFAKAMASATSPQQFFISELQPLEALPDYLAWREEEFPNPPDESELVNVGLWLRDEIDEFTRSQGWKMPSPLTPTVASGWRSTESFDKAITQLKHRGVKIPDDARGSCRAIELDGTPIEIFAGTWLLPQKSTEQTAAIQSEELPEAFQNWSLVLILKRQTGGRLPKGIKLQIRNQTEILCYKTLESMESYFLSDPVEGSLNERFFVTLTLDGDERQLPLFVCQPD